MASKKNALTVKSVQNLKEAGKYLDGSGLYLQITKAGVKSWIYRFDLNKKRREMGLGGVEILTLSEAREACAESRKLLKQGIDPIEHRNAQKAAEDLAKEEAKLRESQNEYESITFKQCADEYIGKKEAEWGNAKHRQQWRNTLRDYVHPHVGHIRVGEVDRSAVLECLNPIWTTKTETATRVRQRIESIIDYAKAMDYRTGDNPAAWKGCLEPILPKPSKLKKTEHHKALPYDQISSFISELKGQEGMGALALQFTILTATRTSEVLNAEWSEIDLAKKLWIIPKERMKAGIEHRVALSSQAISLLESVPKLNDYVFAGLKEGKPLSNLAMTMVLRRMERTDITVHGFRSTFRDWIAEQTHYPARVAETALAHQLKDGAEKAYQRGDLIKKRFEMMEAWAAYCYSHKASVVRLRV